MGAWLCGDHGVDVGVVCPLCERHYFLLEMSSPMFVIVVVMGGRSPGALDVGVVVEAASRARCGDGVVDACGVAALVHGFVSSWR